MVILASPGPPRDFFRTPSGPPPDPLLTPHSRERLNSPVAVPKGTNARAHRARLAAAAAAASSLPCASSWCALRASKRRRTTRVWW
eukprot:300233-Prorocentrum_minimum.AAC.1